MAEESDKTGNAQGTIVEKNQPDCDQRDDDDEQTETDNKPGLPEGGTERRSGQDRRMFSYGYSGYERRSGDDRRKSKGEND